MTEEQIYELAWKHARVKWSSPPGYQFDDPDLLAFVAAVRAHAKSEGHPVIDGAEATRQDKQESPGGSA
jgi:hypothetical protein